MRLRQGVRRVIVAARWRLVPLPSLALSRSLGPGIAATISQRDGDTFRGLGDALGAAACADGTGPRPGSVHLMIGRHEHDVASCPRAGGDEARLLDE
jgi:hypothetical protein